MWVRGERGEQKSRRRGLRRTLDEKENDGGEWKGVCSVLGKVLKGLTSSPLRSLVLALNLIHIHSHSHTRTPEAALFIKVVLQHFE